MTTGAINVLVGVSFVGYFIPAWAADGRHHPQRAAIFVTNIFLGWTFIGWVAALIWSMTAIPADNPAGPGAIRLTIVALFFCVMALLWAFGL